LAKEISYDKLEEIEDETIPMEEQKVPPPDNLPSPEPVLPVTEGQGRTRPGGEGGRYKCRICGKTFNSKTELEMHMESLHNAPKEQTPT
jgi:transposase-like protein